jgi:hypothetical protein
LFEVMMTMGRCRPGRLAGLVDEELHAVEFLQQVVGNSISALSISSISSTVLPSAAKASQSLPRLDVVGTSLTRSSPSWLSRRPADGVVFVEPLLRLGGRLDVPFDQRQAERAGDLARQLGLAGAGLALDQQRDAPADGGVDRNGQVLPDQGGTRKGATG